MASGDLDAGRVAAMLRPDGRSPLHVQVEDGLRHLIRSGQVPVGAGLPGELDLAATLRLSRHTIRHALSTLVAEGLVQRERGRGTRVVDPLVPLQDPVVGPSVRAVHDDPAHAWTVVALAQRSGLSRALFARRFRQAIGEPPLTYVTRWRMTVAADLLEQGELIANVAHRVGYENEFAFAKAFKRVRGVAPGHLRRRRAR